MTVRFGPGTSTIVHYTLFDGPSTLNLTRPSYRRSKADLRRWQGDSEYEVGGGDTSRKQYSKQKNKSTRYRKETDENEEQNESRLASLLGMIRNHRLHGLVRNSFEIALVFERVAVLTNQ